jgi:hypothetical protein
MGGRVKAHSAADLFPLMADDELQALADDIAANGLNQPIVTYDGAILDGRNRYRACEIASVEPEFEEWTDPGCGPVAWVVSQNLLRRHLTATQRASLAVDDRLPKLEAEARERKAAGGRGGIQDPEKVPDLGESRSVAAELFQVNERYISDAKRVRAAAPDLFQKMKDGELSITEAIRKVRDSEKAKEPAKRAKPTYSLDTEKGRQVANTAKGRLEAVIFGLEGYALGADELRVDRAVSVMSAEEVDAWTKSMAQSLRILGKLKKRIRRESESNG